MTKQRQDQCPLCGNVSNDMLGICEDDTMQEIEELYECGACGIYWPTEADINWVKPKKPRRLVK